MSIANSSQIRQFTDRPRPELADVASAEILHPLSNVMVVLFHSTTPGFIQLGSSWYASCILERISTAVFSLFAQIRMFLSLFPSTYHRQNAEYVVDLPHWRDASVTTRCFEHIALSISACLGYIFMSCFPESREMM